MTVAVSGGLTAALKKVVLDLEGDLRQRVESQPEVRDRWETEHKAAVRRERTAMSWQAWRDDRVTQAAEAWVLTTVFVRFCEDNRLLKPVWIAGPAERRQEALDAELAYFRANPEHTDREWLLQAVEYLRNTKATRDLVETRSPLWTVSPSGKAVKRILGFWRETIADGDLVWDFTDPDLSTWFLGDLYEDLSEYARKTFALRQTPNFVAEFILNQTLEPALKERPLEGFTLIDPACGSGHFLLGAFTRLNDRWAMHAPGLEALPRVQEALDAIHGVDINPFAVAIARFRLMVAALRVCELTSLEAAPAFRFHLAAGDSLLHERSQTALDLPGMEDPDSTLGGFAYATEDLAALCSILEPGRYDVVVGNPPYITVKDKKLNEAYRNRYPTCKGTYALTVPFMERFFQLAKPATGDQPAGWAGQITSNSFMKREFGSRLIEGFLSKQDLRLVVDTSGAYIPGHGTPTVILVGRHQPPSNGTVKAVLGARGEPGQPDEPAKGLVWTSIVENIEHDEFDNEYVSVTDLPRTALATHPWSLSGGGAVSLLAAIEAAQDYRFRERTGDIGFMAVTREDDAYLWGLSRLRRQGIGHEYRVPAAGGACVREWQVEPEVTALCPYDDQGLAKANSAVRRSLWPFKAPLLVRRALSGTQLEQGLEWWEYSQLNSRRYLATSLITFPFVSTHNHFALQRSKTVFVRTAPVIKLPEGATEEDHLGLLGVLNSSTACFWLKQNSHNKGRPGAESAGADEPWEHRFEFTGTTLQGFPISADLPVDQARSLDEAAQYAASLFSSLTTDDASIPSAEALSNARANIEATRAWMIAEQEELDWHIYRSYGLVDEKLTYEGSDLPGIRSGERAFAIKMARELQTEHLVTSWFDHWNHRHEKITELPAHWPPAYRELVQRRLDLIASNKFINLLERPEYKRRWATKPWEKRVEKALRGWLLDRLEDRTYWFDAQGRPTARSVAQLADVVGRDRDLVSVLELWSGRKDRSVTQQLSDLLENESVPFLAAYRLKDSGLRKREAWEHTWDLQRREDAGEDVGTIPVPPKYTSADFRKQSWWQHRGKLDVPKERFVLYPAAGRETDSTQLLGWAGWDHAQQALALATVIAEREAEGWSDEQLVPLVAGLAELQPWVRQWHDETDATYQLNLADYLEEELRGRAHQVGMTLDQLRAWRPAPTTRGRKRKA